MSKRPTVVDDDVDDLDDLLDQFTPAPSKALDKGKAAATPGASASTPSKTLAPAAKTSSAAPKPPLGLEDIQLNDEFARELAEGMANLMREFAAEAGTGGVPDQTGDSEEDREREQAFRKVWEDMLTETTNESLNLNGEAADLFAGAGKEKANEVSGQPATATKEVQEDTFQSSIRKAMEKLKESDSNLQAESASNSADPFEDLIKQLGDGLGGTEGGQTEDDLQGILETMMTQLMSKEILYEPLKELSEKFPQYLADNEGKIKPEDLKRYLSQQGTVTKIVSIFDSPGYSDDNPEQGVQIVTLMNEMQSFGSPPPEIMGPLPPGLDVGQDGLPKLPDGCTIV